MRSAQAPSFYGGVPLIYLLYLRSVLPQEYSSKSVDDGFAAKISTFEAGHFKITAFRIV